MPPNAFGLCYCSSLVVSRRAEEQQEELPSKILLTRTEMTNTKGEVIDTWKGHG